MRESSTGPPLFSWLKTDKPKPGTAELEAHHLSAGAFRGPVHSACRRFSNLGAKREHNRSSSRFLSGHVAPSLKIFVSFCCVDSPVEKKTTAVTAVKYDFKSTMGPLSQAFNVVKRQIANRTSTLCRAWQKMGTNVSYKGPPLILLMLAWTQFITFSASWRINMTLIWQLLYCFLIYPSSRHLIWVLPFKQVKLFQQVRITTFSWNHIHTLSTIS